MTAPRPGERFLDTEDSGIVVYLGDHGYGPWWQREGDKSTFYCDWMDYYLWDRFVRLT